MKKILIAMLVLVASATMSNASVINGTSVIEWTSYYQDGIGECKPERMVDGSGFDPITSYHSANGYITPGTMWLSNSGDTAPYVVFDLGAVKNVSKVRIWNYNSTPLNAYLLQGVKKMNILIVDSVGATITDLGEKTLTVAPGSSTVNFGEDFTIDSNNVRYIKFQINESVTAGYNAGLSEVRFYDKNLNNAPNADAGAYQRIWLASGSAVANLAGTAVDDGLPNPPGALTVTWTKASGPGTVAFGNANALSTTATFTVAGTYVLNLNAFDGEFAADDTVSIDVKAEGWTGLVGHWPLDGNANDTSGNGNNGTVIGSVGWVAGQIGQCATFDGSTTGIDIANPSNFEFTDEFTLSFWVKQPAPGAAASVIAKVANPESGNGWYIATGAGAWSPNGMNPVAYEQTSGNYGYGYTSSVTGDQWHHVVFRVDRLNNLDVYIDGAQGFSVGLAYPMTVAPGVPVSFGYRNSSGGARWTGQLDDVRIYNNALTDAQVKGLYQAGGGIICDPAPVGSDLNKDCHVDFKDFALIAADWLNCNSFGGYGCN